MAEDIITSNNFPQNYQDNFDQVTPIEKEDSIKDNLYHLSLLSRLSHIPIVSYHVYLSYFFSIIIILILSPLHMV